MANAAEVGMDENERVTLNFLIGRLEVSSVESAGHRRRWQRERNESVERRWKQ